VLNKEKEIMNIRKPVAVLALAIVLGLGGAHIASAHGYGGGGHSGQHHGGGVQGGDHYAPHNDRNELQTSIYPDGKGGAYHVDDNKVRHCRPADGAEHSLSCTEWK
jgi:hypothetical protein